MLRLPKLRKTRHRRGWSKKDADEDFDKFLGDENLSQDECQTLDLLLTKQQVYYSTNYPQPKRASGIDLPTPTGPFSIESIINYKPPVNPPDPQNNTRDSNTPLGGNNNGNSGNRAWKNSTKRRNLRYSWNPFMTPATETPALRRQSELVAPYNKYNSPLPTPPSSNSCSSERVYLVHPSGSQINESAKSTLTRKQSNSQPPPPGKLSLTKQRAEQTAPLNTAVSSSAAYSEAKLPQEPTDTAPCSTTVLGARSSSNGQRDSFTTDKSTEITNNCRHSDAIDYDRNGLNSNPYYQPEKDICDGAAASGQCQLTCKNHRKSGLASKASGHLRARSVSSPTCFRVASFNSDTLNIGACALNSNNNNNNNNNINIETNHSPNLANTLDERFTQDIGHSPGSPILFDNDTDSLISLYFVPLGSGPNYDESISNHSPDMPLEVATQQFPPHALTTPLSPAPSLTDTAFSSLVTRDSIYNQPFAGLTTAINPGTADIFERSVQHHQQQKQQQQQDGSGGNIPLHFFNDDFIPAVLQASTEALTEPGLDPESIDVLTARRRASSLRSFSFSAAAADYKPPAASLGSLAPASAGKHSYESITGAAPQPPRPRVLSFCSFADLVSSEQPEEVESHTINNPSNNNNNNKQEISSPASLDSSTMITNSRIDENDAGGNLPYPPTRAVAWSRRSSVFSAADNDDLEITSLRQVIRRNSAIMVIS